MNKTLYILLITLFVFANCTDKKDEGPKSDPQSEALLAGIWVNEEDESVAFKAVKDTLYYPDADVMPVHYRIYGDSLYIDGPSPMQYYIEKITGNIFRFQNQNGEVIQLVKTNDKEFESAFLVQKGDTYENDIIQQLVKRDTIVSSGDKRYHCYVQINPTSYKVLKTDYNNEGVGVNKVYYDNIINLAVYEGAQKLFSSDFHKQDFHKYVPKDVLSHSILSDINFDHCDNKGVVFNALLRIPDSASGYLVNIILSPEGKITLVQPK